MAPVPLLILHRDPYSLFILQTWTATGMEEGTEERIRIKTLASMLITMNNTRIHHHNCKQFLLCNLKSDKIWTNIGGTYFLIFNVGHQMDIGYCNLYCRMSPTTVQHIVGRRLRDVILSLGFFTHPNHFWTLTLKVRVREGLVQLAECCARQSELLVWYSTLCYVPA